MQRANLPLGRLAEDKFGTGKHGLTEGDPSTIPAKKASTWNSDLANACVEEIAACVESPGSALDDEDLHQMSRQLYGHMERLALNNMVGITLGNDEKDIRAISHGRNQFDSEEGLFMAVGNDGVVFTSRDGQEWDEFAWEWPDLNIYDCAWHPGITRWVAVGEDGQVARSTNGDNWVAGVNPTNDLLRAIDYGAGDGVCIAVGNNGRLLTTTDGLVWIQQDASTAETLNAVAYDAVNEGWWAVGDNGVVRWSPDGDLVNWTSYSTGDTDDLQGVAVSSEGLIVFVGLGGKVITSRDAGDNFTITTMDSVDGGANGPPVLLDVAIARSGMVVIVGAESEDGSAPNRIFTSCDNGLTFNAHRNDNDLASLRQRSVAVGDGRKSTDPANGTIITAGDLGRANYSLRM